MTRQKRPGPYWRWHCPEELDLLVFRIESCIKWAKLCFDVPTHGSLRYLIFTQYLHIIHLDPEPVAHARLQAIRQLQAYSHNLDQAGLSNVIAQLQVAGLDHLLGKARKKAHDSA